MAPKPYPGSCHCGLITYTVQLDLDLEETPQSPTTTTTTSPQTTSKPTLKTNKCNCTICTKTRSWETLVSPSEFHLNPSSAQSLTEYRFGTRKVAHLFCKVCGCRPFGRGVWKGEEFVAVSLACLDGVGEGVLAGLEVVYRNGREGRFGERPLGAVAHL